MDGLAVQYRSVEELIPYARNARQHSPGQIAQLAGAIVEFGWTNPILVDETGNIIAGHGRLLAARQLEMLEVPTITISGLTAAQRRALVLFDNKSALNATWDLELLKIELDDIQGAGFSLDFTGFSMDEIKELWPSQSTSGFSLPYANFHTLGFFLRRLPRCNLGKELTPAELRPTPALILSLWALLTHRLLVGRTAGRRIP